MAVIGVPLINGVEYTHADITLNVLGIPVIGVVNIDYSDPQEITGNHSTGTKVTSVGFGPVNCQGSITLTMKEVQRLSVAATAAGIPGGRLQNIPFFDIGVNYLTEAGDFVRHRLIKCRFKGRNPNSVVNNSQIEEQIELFISDISYTA
jgi:hypothetical protein